MGNTCCCCSCSAPDYQDLFDKVVQVEDMTHIDELISYIDQLLTAIDQGRIQSIPRLAKTNRVAASLNTTGGLLEKILKRSKHICTRNIVPNLNRETRKLMIDVTNQAAQIKCVGVALSVVGFVLERIDQVSSNIEECIQLLKYMFSLAKYIKQLDHHLGNQEKLNRSVQFIVEGSLLCISLMQSHSLSKFFAAPVAADDLKKLQRGIGQEYSELTMESILEVLNRIPVVLPPSQGRSPQAVGIEEERNHVTQLLDMESKSVKAVVIYGQGGIGKTTLAHAVFSKLQLQNYKYCKIYLEQNCSEADLKVAQKQICRDLYKSNIDFRNLNEGREQLSKYFEERSSKPVFIFVDNALKQDDLERLLPICDLKSLPAQSRILLTTRNLNETRIILQPGVERCPYQVPCLPQEKAQEILSELALDNARARFDPTIDIDGLLKICQGIPLVLKMAGPRLREHAQNVAACREGVDYLKSWLLQGGEGDLSERMVDFVYNRLDASCKEAFLDIVFFLCNWKQQRVVSSVGATEFEELERAALVNVTDEGRVNVHDIVKARGRMLPTDGKRITNLQSLRDVLDDAESIKKIKGIAINESFELEAHHLNLMKRCLRVLILTEPIRIVNGECKGAFENLRLLSIENHNNYSWMDVSKQPRLSAIILRYVKDSNVPEFAAIIPSSLRYVCIKGVRLTDLITTLYQVQSLNCLSLQNCSGFNSLSESIINKLLSLENLDLRSCSSLGSLPDSFGSLSSLNSLDLRSCSSLGSLPDSFGSLSSLKSLDFSSCSSLGSLPDSFGSLSSLNSLDLSFCSSLGSLPDSFGSLSSLNYLDLRSCSSLGSLPDSFGSLSSLNYLDLSFCSSLGSLPDSFGSLSSLNSLSLSSCSSLGSLPDSFGSLSSLNYLNLSSCSSLGSLPDSFGSLSSLNSLYLSSCSSLGSLPDSFGNLDGLLSLYLIKCTQLSLLPESFGSLASLERLVFRECEKLVNLPQNFGQLKSLKYVSIDGCSVLQSLSGDFECLTSLIAVKASECPELEENTMEKLAKTKGLLMVDIQGSPNLKKQWEQVKEQYSLAVVECGRQEWSEEMYQYADVMGRAFLNNESKLVHVDENGQLRGVPSPAGGEKLWMLVKERDVRASASSNSRCWEAVKKKWMEVVASEGGQMIYADVGGSREWEERERRVREALPHLPSGTVAWMAPDNRPRLLFAYSLQHYYKRHIVEEEAKLGVGNCIVGASVCVDEEGRRRLDLDHLHFILPNLDKTPPFAESECEDISDQLFSPISKAIKFLRNEYFEGN